MNEIPLTSDLLTINVILLNYQDNTEKLNGPHMAREV